MSKYLGTSERQFGFKKGVSCSHAIFSVRKITEYFVKNGSTVNLCSLDLTKAFDRMNHGILFNKLMDRNIPKYLVNLLREWYSEVFNAVRWGSEISKFIKLEAGVRQGGILSPYLFAVFVDDLLIKLENSKFGCYFKTVCFNSMMYADDLVLLSISLTHMKKMGYYALKNFET